ncbi:MAG: hypothetical protein H6824_02820 [Planctomycetaceae bacterium]|nr:hypothetical protein [Planctomycetaceae bacterium]
MGRQAFAFFSAILFVGIASSVLADDTPVGDGPWKLPKTWEKGATPEEQQYAYYDFIWRSFVALNWPNVDLKPDAAEPWKIGAGMRGKPDTSATLKELPNRLAVWETYKEPGEVFPDPKVWDEPQFSQWNTVRPSPPGSQQHAGIPARRILDFETITEYTSGTTQPYFFPFRTGPLYDQHGGLVRYEVAINHSFFEYVRYFEYYNAQKQADAVWTYIREKEKRGTKEAFQRPPFGNPRELSGYLKGLPEYDQVGLVDVKAAWRVLDPKRDKDILHRYLVRELHHADGSDPQLMGLVALHVLRWTPNGYDQNKGIDGGFVASTFEQIDNVTSNVERKSSGELQAVPATFNDGMPPTAEELEYGFAGEIPKINCVDCKEELVPPTSPVNIYRATAQAIPPAVQKINQQYQSKPELQGSPLQYYQLIGTQNRHPGPMSFDTPAERETNGPQGPTTGVYSNANNLVNSALESYTQKNFTCLRCHIQARPKTNKLTTMCNICGRVCTEEHEKKGIDSFAMRAFEDDHFKILTFLLQIAKFPGE